ncbi:MAG TPA: cytochrome c [Candidatus Limnocylindrales bacterium]|nr:cytochrome c [Candidatus Limnocylindrales bacterium]
MKPFRPNEYVLLFLALLIAVIVAAGTSWNQPAQASQNTQLIRSLQGPDLYRAHCAPCHGLNGKGDGPVAPALIGELPDLTTIAQRNGGKYPAERMERVIAGQEETAAHGSRDMPVWGPIFHQVEEDRDYGAVRLHNLTEYIRSIQK